MQATRTPRSEIELHLVNGTRERVPVDDALRAAFRVTREADRAQAAIGETRRKVEETVRRSRLVREEVARARAARASATERRREARDETLVALHIAAERLLSLTEAAERRAAQERPESGQGPDTAPLLTRRQREILALVADGVGTEEIGARLWLSVATVRNHVARTLRALDAHSRVEAVAKARRLGLL